MSYVASQPEQSTEDENDMVTNLFDLSVDPTKAIIKTSATEFSLISFESTLIKGDVTAGSNKISLGGIPTGAVIGAGVSIDVVEANIDHNVLTNTHNLTTDIDHGSIAGLGDDDHTQYVLRQPTADTVINESGGDFDWQIKGVGDTNLFYVDAGNDRVGIGIQNPTKGKIEIVGNIAIGGSNNELRFYEGANYVGFEAPALTANQIWVLPSADGNASEFLKTDGAGNLAFSNTLKKLEVNQTAAADIEDIQDNGTVVRKMYDGGIMDLPKQSGCRVRLTSDQTIPTATWTKMALATEDWDIQNEFDSVTNYRFTATKAGKYQLNVQIYIDSLADTNAYSVGIKKNGAFSNCFSTNNVSAPLSASVAASDIVDLAIGDYIEAFFVHWHGSNRMASADIWNNYLAIIKVQ